MVDSVIQLKCECNNYPWGKVGQDSLAARLCSKTPGTDFNLDNGTNYAEMWMGTYPVTPSYVLKTGEKLQDVLDANQEKLIGKAVLDKFGSQLPFLPKILSIQKAVGSLVAETGRHILTYTSCPFKYIQTSNYQRSFTTKNQTSLVTQITSRKLPSL